MQETLGRGRSTDESRVEREAKRAPENPSSTGKPAAATSPAVAAVNSQVQSSVATTLSGGSVMSNQAADFEYQIQLLKDLKQYLSDFQARLQGVSLNYQRKVEQLREAGMMRQTYESFVTNELAETQALMSKLVDHIDHHDIPTVEREISFLESH